MVRPLLCLMSLVALGEANGHLRRQSDSPTDENDVPLRHYRRRALQSAVKAGDYIYIDGGETSNYVAWRIIGGLDTGSSPINAVRALPLTESWNNLTFRYTITMSDDAPDAVNQFAMWADTEGERVYRWGGAVPRNGNMSEDDVVLRALSLDGNGSGEWGTREPSNEDTFDDILGTMAGASASCDRKGFWIGGIGRGSTDPRLEGLEPGDQPPVPGILTYDMVTRRWSNDSTAPMTPPYGSLVNGAAHCVEAFDTTPLVFRLGGLVTSPTSTASNQTIPLDNITFWDPGSSKWLWQTAKGDVPSGRELPCLAGVKGENTYEIFMYGGRTAIGGSNGDMYILSLPGFQWFRANVSSPERIHHSCTAMGNKQMLSIGGLASEFAWDEPDPWVKSVGIFDMTDLTWLDGYDADAAAYRPAAAIQDWYDQGNLDNVEWSGDEVRAMFSQASNTPPGDGGGGDDDKSATDTGAIAGGVVGGVAGVAIIGAIVWFILRRRRQRSAYDAFQGDDAAAAAAAAGGDPSSISPTTQAKTMVGDSPNAPSYTAVDTSPPDVGSNLNPAEMPVSSNEVAELPPDTNSRAELPGRP